MARWPRPERVRQGSPIGAGGGICSLQLQAAGPSAIDPASEPPPMKRQVCIGSLLWLLLITVSHVHLNVGWSGFVQKSRVFFGLERPELIVGFLPVT